MMSSRCTISFAAALAMLCLALDGAAETVTVTTAADFQWALGVAAANGEHDTINVAAGYYNLATSGVGALIYTPAATENFALTIVGEGASATVVHEGQPNLVINTSGITDTQANVTIRDIGLNYGNSYSTTYGGGGLFVRTTSAEITIENCTFGENGALNNGAGAYLRSEVGLITLTNCAFYDNTAVYDGAGLWIRCDSGMVTLTDCEFFFNDCGMFGGGVCARSDHAPMYFTTNTFHGNSSGWDGGGVYAHSSYGSISFQTNTFSSNDAPLCEGGGAYALSLNGTVALGNNTVSDNTAADGGGVYVKGETVAVTGNTFSSNYAADGGTHMGKGGGLLAESVVGTITLASNVFDGNSAEAFGGGAYAETEVGGQTILRKNTFINNTADSSGGGAKLRSVSGGTMTLTNNVFYSNSVMPTWQGEGGGATVTCGTGGTVILTNNTVVGNSASGGLSGSAGGGIRLLLLTTTGEAKAFIYNNIIWGNVADGAADLWVQDGAVGPGGLPPIKAAVYLFNNDYSDFHIIWGDNLSEGNNIDADPLLSSSFHLQLGSPCIDTGTNGAPGIPLTDFEDEPRIIDGDFDGTATADIGADEYFPFILTIPRITITNFSDQLPPLHPMSGGTMGKGAMSFWFMEPGDQMPRYWGSRAFDAEVGPGEKALYEFEWPMSNIEPSNDATIFWRFETAMEVVHGGLIGEYPVYAFPAGTESPEQPAGPPLVELKGRGGLIDTLPLFGFASQGTLVGAAEFKVAYPVEAAFPVNVDVKPGSERNPINVKSRGVLPVAVLGTDEFDVTTIDPGSILLRREGIEEGVAPIRWCYADVAAPFDGALSGCCGHNGDGHLDLVLKFKVPELVRTLKLCEVTGQTVPLIVTGNLEAEEGGTSITGQDDVQVLKPCGWRHRRWWRWCCRRLCKR